MKTKENEFVSDESVFPWNLILMEKCHQKPGVTNWAGVMNCFYF